MPSDKPVRGEVWDANLDPVKGHEQAGRRPVLVVSVDELNQGPSGLVIVIPMTTKDRRIRSWIPIEPAEGGLKARSFAMCEAIRSISIERLARRRGTVSYETTDKVRFCLQALLDL
jgi:mRNA interferase MazF